MLALPWLEHMKQVAQYILAAAAGGSLGAYRHRHVFHACHKLRVPSGKQTLTSAICVYLAVYVLTALQSSIECHCCTAHPSPNHLVFDDIQCVMTMLQRPAQQLADEQINFFHQRCSRELACCVAAVPVLQSAACLAGLQTGCRLNFTLAYYDVGHQMY